MSIKTINEKSAGTYDYRPVIGRVQLDQRGYR